MYMEQKAVAWSKELMLHSKYRISEFFNSMSNSLMIMLVCTSIPLYVLLVYMNIIRYNINFIVLSQQIQYQLSVMK